MLRSVCRAALIVTIVLPALAAAAAPITAELNNAEMVDNRCVLTFVVENKGKDNIDTLRFVMFLFNQDNRVYRRLVTEMGPLRGEKTVVKLYPAEGACSDLRSVLLSEVAACAPAKPDVCLDDLTLSSRVSNVRFYK